MLTNGANNNNNNNNNNNTVKEDIAVRRGFSLLGPSVEDPISKIIMFNSLLHIPVAWCLNHSRKENLCFWLIIIMRR